MASPGKIITFEPVIPAGYSVTRAARGLALRC